MTEPAIACDVLCPACGYNLYLLTSDKCPECGFDLTGLRDPAPQLPWARRKEIGRCKAYWQTIWWVRFRHRRFCAEMARPVSYADAQRFRWVTILHAMAGVVLFSVLLWAGTPTPAELKAREVAKTYRFGMPNSLWETEEFWAEVVHEIWPVVLGCVSIALFLAAATGVPSYFFHPRSRPVELQNRAVALSYYTCGPIALMVVSLLVLLYALRAPPIAPKEAILALVLFGLLFVMWWGGLVQTLRVVHRPHRARMVALALGVPLLWGVVALLTLLAVPVIVVYVVIVFVSLA